MVLSFNFLQGGIESALGKLQNSDDLFFGRKWRDRWTVQQVDVLGVQGGVFCCVNAAYQRVGNLVYQLFVTLTSSDLCGAAS